uniref:PLAT domain-containing protein n=1 Tax=Sinocyclocheilus anshuiensis TaxID=1608454 RepID=A0A671NNH7_9TELE
MFSNYKTSEFTREGAFQRNSLDDFQIETDLPSFLLSKITNPHKQLLCFPGLDPSWFLQQVIVWDIQTDNMFFFLVEDWLPVVNEKNSGRVEKVFLASCKYTHAVQRKSYLLFITFRFSRAQRVTCCALLLHLYLAAGAVWYGAVGRKGSSGPVSTQMVMNAENILVGITVAALMFPFQTILRFFFQNTKSKVYMSVYIIPSETIL